MSLLDLRFFILTVSKSISRCSTSLEFLSLSGKNLTTFPSFGATLSYPSSLCYFKMDLQVISQLFCICKELVII